MVRLIKAMQMKGARSVEFGYFPNDYDREPGPEEIVTWWAKAEMQIGRAHV